MSEIRLQFIPADAKCKCGAHASYWHPHIGTCCKGCLEKLFRDIIKIPNWRVA